MGRILSFLCFLATAAVLVVATATPAFAHSASGGLDATNYLTRLHEVRPSISGIDLRVIEAGSRLELRNRTRDDVVVLGYQDEPYLRIGPEGVFQNRRSPAVYLNADRNQTEAPPPSADPKAAPAWRKVSSTPLARWHDHRTHWMLDREPPQVRRDPGRRHVVFEEWEVPFTVDGREVVATGDLIWEPGPSVAPWIVWAAALAALAIALSLSRVWAPAIAVLTLALVASDGVHAIGVQWFGEFGTGTRVARLLGAGIFSVVAWVVGVIGAWMLARRRPDGLLLVAIAALLVLLFGGIVDVGDLSRSQLPFAFAADLGRATVAIALGLGGGLLVGSMLALRRIEPDEAVEDTDGVAPATA